MGKYTKLLTLDLLTDWTLLNYRDFESILECIYDIYSINWASMSSTVAGGVLRRRVLSSLANIASMSRERSLDALRSSTKGSNFYFNLGSVCKDFWRRSAFVLVLS